MADPVIRRHPSHVDIAWTWPESPDEAPALKGGAIHYRDTTYEDGKRVGFAMVDPRDVDLSAQEITDLLGSAVGQAKAAETAATKRAETAEAKVADLQPKADALPGETARANAAEAKASANQLAADKLLLAESTRANTAEKDRDAARQDATDAKADAAAKGQQAATLAALRDRLQPLADALPGEQQARQQAERELGAARGQAAAAQAQLAAVLLDADTAYALAFDRNLGHASPHGYDDMADLMAYVTDASSKDHDEAVAGLAWRNGVLDPAWQEAKDAAPPAGFRRDWAAWVQGLAPFVYPPPAGPAPDTAPAAEPAADAPEKA